MALALQLHDNFSIINEGQTVCQEVLLFFSKEEVRRKVEIQRNR